MEIVIAGVNGFIGSSIANYLVKKGYSVKGIGRQEHPRSFVSKDVKYQCLDVQNPVPKISAHVIINCIGSADDHASYEELIKRNVNTVLEISKATMEVEKYIYISTSSVYKLDNEKVAEDDRLEDDLNYLSPYGKSKRMAEKELLLSRGGLSTTILRPRIVYGIGDRLILPRLLRLIKKDQLVTPSNLSKRISLTHIQNLVEAVELSIQKKQIGASIFNICDKNEYDLNVALPALVESAYGKKLKRKKIPVVLWKLIVLINSVLKFNKNITRFGSKQITSVGVMDASKAENILGYKANYEMSDCLEEIRRWVSENGGWEMYRDIGFD